MNYSQIARINRCGFTRATIALIIELAVYSRHDYRAIGRIFSCSDKTVAMYVRKYYYGTVRRGGKKTFLIRQSALNDFDRKEAAA
jgi:hypothetical protein